MVPIKPNDGSPGLCQAMGNKEALPSDPKGNPPNSSLMKALDAVITAGRRGLLGPAAMVSPVPALNLDGGKVVASRENLKQIPLVAGHDQRKKAFSEKRTAVITVVPSAEGESSKATNQPLEWSTPPPFQGNLEMFAFLLSRNFYLCTLPS